MAVSEGNSLGTLYKVNVPLIHRETESCPRCDTLTKLKPRLHFQPIYFTLVGWGGVGWGGVGGGAYPMFTLMTTSWTNPDFKPKFNNIQKCFELRRKSTKSFQLVRKCIHLPKSIIRHQQNASVIRISTQLSETAQDCPVSVRMRAERYTLCSRLR
jgi:hypothetical protein